ncbi:MAG: hypothetical protein GEV12_13410 [Micromonosporaceae bacterium]|nr:hypothetical protein [Micromonosporaceae bacterium]
MIPAAAALLWLVGLGGRGIRSLTSVALAVASLLHVGVQQELLDGAHDALVRTATNHVAMADFLRSEYDVRPPCLLWGEGVIQQSYLLKCDSWFRRGQAPVEDDSRIEDAMGRGDTVVVRLRSDVQVPEFMADWRRAELPGTDRYVVYLPRDE